MTVATTATKIQYLGDGSTVNWGFTFAGGPDNTDIQVVVTDTSGNDTTLTSNYSVTLNPPIDPNPTGVGGFITYPLAGGPAPPGTKITIIRNVPYVQPTSFINQGILYQGTVEGSDDNLELQIQQLLEILGRTLRVAVSDGQIAALPNAAARALKVLGFDANGNPVMTGDLSPIVDNNGIRVPPPETVPPLPGASARPGTIIGFDNLGNPILISVAPPNLPPLFGGANIFTGSTTVSNADSGKLFVLNGNTQFDLNFADASAYPAGFSVAVFNADEYTGPNSGRGKRIMLGSQGLAPGGFLYPGQWAYVYKYGNSWVTNPMTGRWKPTVAPTFFVNPVLGKDDGTTDGLASGAGAIQTIARAVLVATRDGDYGYASGPFNTGPTIQLDPGVHPCNNLRVAWPTIGGRPILIQGVPAGGPGVPGNYQIECPVGGNGLIVDNGASIYFLGMQFQCTTGLGSTAVLTMHGSQTYFNNCIFYTFPNGVPIHAFDNCVLEIVNCSIISHCSIFLALRRGSIARLWGSLQVGNGLNFSAFMYADMGSSIVGATGSLGDNTDYVLVGGAGCTGARYIIVYNSIGHLGVGNMDALPGNAPGQCGTTVTHGTDASIVM